VRDGGEVLGWGKFVVRAETVPIDAREEDGTLDQSAVEDVLVEPCVVVAGGEHRPGRLLQGVVLAGMVVIAVAVRVAAAMVVGVAVRHGLLMERYLLYRDVCTRSPRPRRDQLG
jgi:hypothetical protein